MKHAGGAAKIFKYRGKTCTGDKLEQKLLLSLRGPVVSCSILFFLFSNEEYFHVNLTGNAGHTISLPRQALFYPLRMEPNCGKRDRRRQHRRGSIPRPRPDRLAFPER